MIDIDVSQSPGWWMHRLDRLLQAQVKELDPLDKRLRGEGPLPHVTDGLRESFREFQRKSRTNWPEIIVEAARERMTVVGFRTASETPATRGLGIASQDPSDDAAMAIWRANNLAVDSADVHESMLGLRYGYVIVGPPQDGEFPVITGEDPLQVITVHDPVTQKVRAALKLFHDDELEQDFAYLYLPGEIHVATRKVRRRTSNPVVRFASRTWDWDEERTAELPEAFRDTVPVVRFRNRKGVSEFEHHTDLLDRIDFQVLQRVAGAALQAFRQRAIQGDLPDEDSDGNKIDYKTDDIFAADPGALWLLPQGVELWESGQIDLTSILAAGQDDLKQLSALTKTPLNQLMPGEVAQSAEGAAFQREGLVFRVEDRIARATEGWRDVMAYAFRYLDDEERSDRNRIEVLWAPAERRSLAERADAASKAQDIPWRSRMIHIWGFTPSEVDQMEVERTQDALLTAVASGSGNEDDLSAGGEGDGGDGE